MRIRNILEGQCGHRPLQTTAKIQRILRADRVVRPYKGYWIERVGRAKIAAFPILRRRGRCPHRPTLQNENTPVGADGRYCIGFRFSPRRGGRPCPPAGIVRFYGNPMRIRNISMGRCRHRPLHEVVFPIPYRRGRCPHRPAGNSRFYGNPMRIRNILKGGQSRPPLQMVGKTMILYRTPLRTATKNRRMR